MFKYHCLNTIANVGLEKFSDNYAKTDSFDEAQGVLVRSAAMHDLDLPDSLLAVARSCRFRAKIHANPIFPGQRAGI